MNFHFLIIRHSFSSLWHVLRNKSSSVQRDKLKQSGHSHFPPFTFFPFSQLRAESLLCFGACGAVRTKPSELQSRETRRGRRRSRENATMNESRTNTKYRKYLSGRANDSVCDITEGMIFQKPNQLKIISGSAVEYFCHFLSPPFQTQQSTVGSAGLVSMISCGASIMTTAKNNNNNNNNNKHDDAVPGLKKKRKKSKRKEIQETQQAWLPSYLPAGEAKTHGSRGEDDERCCSALWEGPCVPARLD